MLILLRHGRTPNNAEARIQGLHDAPLDPVGIAQATRAGDYIRSRWDIDAVVASSLTRARQTVEHAGFGHHDVVTDDRWKEINFGNYDRRPIREVVTELAARWRADINYAPDCGESMAAMHERVSEACMELAAQAAEENVLVVTHATPIKSAAVWALGGQASMILNLWVNLATVSVLSEVHGEFILSEYNSHVPNPGAPED